LLFASGCTLNHIRREAFTDTQLQELTIPSSIVKLGFRGFWRCTSLTKVLIPEDSSLEIIESYCFVNSKISQLRLPRFLSSVDATAILMVENLSLAADNKRFIFDGNVLFDFAKTKIIWAKSVNLPFKIPLTVKLLESIVSIQ
jgi:hypothetical protein